jgi:hypothetical protein
VRVLYALLFVVLAACVGPTFIVQQYNGPPRPRETIATLRVNGAESVRLLFLDDEDVAAPIVSDGRLHIELLPGKHTLTARNGDDRSATTGSLSFMAEAGKVYRVVFSGESQSRPHRRAVPPGRPAGRLAGRVWWRP